MYFSLYKFGGLEWVVNKSNASTLKTHLSE